MNALAAPSTLWLRTPPGVSPEARSLRDSVRRIESSTAEPRTPSTGTAFDILEPTIVAELWPRWREPCEGAFEHLAEKHPDALLCLIQSGELEPGDLSFAAEIAGRVPRPKQVRAALLPLLRHDEPVVREGALYGLAGVVDDSVRRELRRLADEDESEGVRTIARDRLLRS